ncbi:MAG: epimerase [Humibacillus sp.]|nr:epimerase [Humibacillus sp.]
MMVLARIFVGLAAVLHAYIFYMESLAWTRPAVWQRFSIADQQTAETTRPMAYNQGFYNLFLGIGAAIGLVLWWTGHETAGRTLVIFSTASMVAAATVLITSGRQYLRAALSQGTLPLVGLVLTLLA